VDAGQKGFDFFKQILIFLTRQTRQHRMLA